MYECIITLDPDYGAKLKHFSGDLNTSAGSLSHLEMTEKVPNNISKINGIDKLNHDINKDFPLEMMIHKLELDEDEKL